MALDPKKRKFVNEFVKTGKVGKSARKAGYPPKAAHVTGSRLLKDAKVCAAIEKQVEKVSEKAALSAAEVLAEIRKLAFVDLSKAYAKDGSLLHPTDMPEDLRAALHSVESDEILVGRGNSRTKIGNTKKIKLFDKVRSLEMLAKHFKLLTDIQEVSGPNGAPQVIVHTFANGSEAEPESEV